MEPRITKAGPAIDARVKPASFSESTRRISALYLTNSSILLANRLTCIDSITKCRDQTPVLVISGNEKKGRTPVLIISCAIWKTDSCSAPSNRRPLLLGFPDLSFTNGLYVYRFLGFLFGSLPTGMAPILRPSRDSSSRIILLPRSCLTGSEQFRVYK